MLGGEGKVDRIFMDCFNAAGFTQWVLEPTYVSSGNTLDLFLTSKLDRVGAVTVYVLFPKCGPSPVVCDYLLMFDSDLDTNIYEEIELKYLWHRGDYCRMSNTLSRVDWELEFCHPSLNSAYESFLNILNNLVDSCVPMCENTHRLPWSLNSPAALKFARTKAWKQYKEFRTAYGRHSDFVTRELVELNEINYRLRHFVTSSRASYEKSFIDGYSDAPKLFHSYEIDWQLVFETAFWTGR